MKIIEEKYKETIDGVVAKETTATFYYNEKNELHREDGPAMSWSNGQEEWFWLGQRHRENGPALISPNGQFWWRHGHLHRDNDEPAWIEVGFNACEKWYNDGLLHREDDKPAVIYKSGIKEFWQHGKFVRRES